MTNQGVRSLEELYQRCQSLSFQSPLRQKFLCHYQADKGCEDVPKDTKQGPIRKFYEELQANAHCKDMLTVNTDHSLPAPEVVLSMIFFENIRGNFYRLYRAELQELDTWLSDLGLLPMNLLERERSRAQLLADIREMRQSLMKWGRGHLYTEDFKIRFLIHQQTLQRLQEIDKVLLQLTPACVPSTWVDPLVVSRSSCMTSTANLRNQADKYWSKIALKGEK